ncbi:MAG TPA: hypothetical protein VGB63_13760 [Pedobacter sp.]|jgi:hypothetical protein
MRYILSILFAFILSQTSQAQQLDRYKIHLVSWDKSRVTGRLAAISDTTISAKIMNGNHEGKIFTFSASQTKNLKIWKSGYSLPFALGAGSAIALAAGNSDEGMSKSLGIVLGVPAGVIIGLIYSDLLFTKVNKRQLHLTSFKQIRHKLQ